MCKRKKEEIKEFGSKPHERDHRLKNKTNNIAWTNEIVSNLPVTRFKNRISSLSTALAYRS